MSITITESAAKRIKHLISNKEGAVAFSFTAKEAGCSGYSYVMDILDVVDDESIVSDQHGVTVVTNQFSLDLFGGIEVDYVSEGLNSTFKFRNPKAEAECGCGESFAVSA